MRIHVQNAANDPDFAITPAMWRAADGPKQVTFGDTADAFHAGVAEADALVTTTAALAQYFSVPVPHLKMIFCTSAGLDRLAPFDFLPAGVALVNNSGVHGPRAGEYAAMAMLMLAAKMPAILKAQHEGRWEKHYSSVLAGRHVAVIGTGGVGAAVGKMARMFGMHSVGVRTRALAHPDFDAVVSVDDLDAVLPKVEFLVLAAPLTPRTQGMIGRDRLERLPEGAFVINIGRGALIEQEALCDLLDSGRLGGAVLDVFVPEPIPAGHRLWTTRNLMITPHVAADDPKTYAADSLKLFQINLAAFEAGEPMPNLFDIKRGY